MIFIFVFFVIFLVVGEYEMYWMKKERGLKGKECLWGFLGMMEDNVYYRYKGEYS